MFGAFPVAQSVKNVPAVKETACNEADPVSIPGLGRSPEKEMAIHSSILAWENLVDRGAGKLHSRGLLKSWT